MSREDVIRRLVWREQRQLDLSENTVSGDDPELHELACALWNLGDGFGVRGHRPVGPVGPVPMGSGESHRSV